MSRQAELWLPGSSGLTARQDEVVRCEAISNSTRAAPRITVTHFFVIADFSPPRGPESRNFPQPQPEVAAERSSGIKGPKDLRSPCAGTSAAYNGKVVGGGFPLRGVSVIESIHFALWAGI